MSKRDLSPARQSTVEWPKNWKEYAGVHDGCNNCCYEGENCEVCEFWTKEKRLQKQKKEFIRCHSQCPQCKRWIFCNATCCPQCKRCYECERPRPRPKPVMVYFIGKLVKAKASHGVWGNYFTVDELNAVDLVGFPISIGKSKGVGAFSKNWVDADGFLWAEGSIESPRDWDRMTLEIDWSAVYKPKNGGVIVPFTRKLDSAEMHEDFCRCGCYHLPMKNDDDVNQWYMHDGKTKKMHYTMQRSITKRN